MLAYFRYGDVTKILNTNCKCGVVIEHLRKAGNYDQSLVLDISDKDGNVKLLRNNVTAYANTMLAVGETYYLISAQEDGKQYTYTLLANMKPEENPIEVKPTKMDKVIPKKPPPKAQSRAKKTK